MANDIPPRIRVRFSLPADSYVQLPRRLPFKNFITADDFTRQLLESTHIVENFKIINVDPEDFKISVPNYLDGIRFDFLIACSLYTIRIARRARDPFRAKMVKIKAGILVVENGEFVYKEPDDSTLIFSAEIDLIEKCFVNYRPKDDAVQPSRVDFFGTWKKNEYAKFEEKYDMSKNAVVIYDYLINVVN